MTVRTARKVMRQGRLLKGRLLSAATRRSPAASPPVPVEEIRGDRLPARPLTAADLIAMARAARTGQPGSADTEAPDR